MANNAWPLNGKMVAINGNTQGMLMAIKLSNAKGPEWQIIAILANNGNNKWATHGH